MKNFVGGILLGSTVPVSSGIGFSNAILAKPDSNPVTPEEFLECGSLFSEICNEIYLGGDMTFFRNGGIRHAAKGARQIMFDGASGELVDMRKMTRSFFEEIFDSSSSVAMVVRPKIACINNLHSLAGAVWSRNKSRTIFFVMQGTLSKRKEFERMMLEKLF